MDSPKHEVCVCTKPVQDGADLKEFEQLQIDTKETRTRDRQVCRLRRDVPYPGIAEYAELIPQMAPFPSHQKLHLAHERSGRRRQFLLPYKNRLSFLG